MSGAIIDITGCSFAGIFSRVQICTPVGLLFVGCPKC